MLATPLVYGAGAGSGLGLRAWRQWHLGRALCPSAPAKFGADRSAGGRDVGERVLFKIGYTRGPAFQRAVRRCLVRVGGLKCGCPGPGGAPGRRPEVPGVGMVPFPPGGFGLSMI